MSQLYYIIAISFFFLDHGDEFFGQDMDHRREAEDDFFGAGFGGDFFNGGFDMHMEFGT